MARVSEAPPCPPNLEWLFGGPPGSAALVERLTAFGRDRLIAIILQLLGWIAELRGDDKNLRARLSQNSRNSSRPPSSDGPDKPAPKSQRKSTGRKSGGQPGHKGVTIEMKKVADHYEYCKLDLSEHCDCGEPLSLAKVLEDVRRQLWDLPPPPPLVVTEWRAQSRCCQNCGKVHTAQFPEGIDQMIQYGPGVQGIVFYLSQYQLIPYKRNQELMHDLFGVDLSQGTIHNIRKRAHAVLWDFEVDMTALMVMMRLLHFDETGIRVKDSKDKYWLHVACTALHTLYHADRRRGTQGMRRMAILPKFKGIAVHDHWDPYFFFVLCAHVLCNSHHLRELTYAHEQYQQPWAKKLLDCLVQINDEVIAAKERGETALSAQRLAYFDDLYDDILKEGKKEVLLLPAPPPPKKPKKGGKPAQHKVKNLYDRLVEFKSATLAFMHDFRIPFSNNQGERDIRMAKVMLKISGCFRSVLGAKMFARARSYISTAKKQGINVIEAVTAIFSGNAGPLIRRMTTPRT
jgi:transposase